MINYEEIIGKIWEDSKSYGWHPDSSSPIFYAFADSFCDIYKLNDKLCGYDDDHIPTWPWINFIGTADAPSLLEIDDKTTAPFVKLVVFDTCIHSIFYNVTDKSNCITTISEHRAELSDPQALDKVTEYLKSCNDLMQRISMGAAICGVENENE